VNVELLCITKNAEELIETAARTCYKSEVGENNGKFIKSLIRMRHLSVLEHAYCTFRINGCSRAMTHQLVRHRLMAISQQSQRYVKEEQFDYVVPPAIKNLEVPEGNLSAEDQFKLDMQAIQRMYLKWKGMGIRNEDARFVLPNACQSEIVISFNMREARHIFEVRCDKHAQWEIREVANEMLRVLAKEAPSIFGDLAEKFLN